MSPAASIGFIGTGTIGNPIAGRLLAAGQTLIVFDARPAVQEGFVLAAKAGLGARELLEILNASSAKLYTGIAPLLLGRNFDMTLFKLGIAEKDIALALDSARKLGAELPLAEAAAQTYRRAVDEGCGEKAFFATLETLERAAGTSVEKVA